MYSLSDDKSPPMTGEERMYEIKSIIESLDILAERYQILDMRTSEGFVLNARSQLMKLKHLEEIMK